MRLCAVTSSCNFSCASFSGFRASRARFSPGRMAAVAHPGAGLFQCRWCLPLSLLWRGRFRGDGVCPAYWRQPVVDLLSAGRGAAPRALIFRVGPRPTGPAHISPAFAGVCSLSPCPLRHFGLWRVPGVLAGQGPKDK